MANKFPLILNTSANQIQEIASGDNLDLTGCKIVGLQGINSAGIVTFTKAHVGAATTWGEDLVVTGNARVTGILTVGTNSVTISGNDVNITGVTTSANFKTGTSNLHNVGLEIAGINVLGADTPIGTGATIYNSGAAVFTGIVTAANYVGTINTPVQPNITSVGTLSALNVSGNVSIGGTLTYEDVTNIDAVGLITARAGINIQGSSTFSGNVLDFGEGKSLRFGAGNDFAISHSTNTLLENDTAGGNLTINNKSTSGKIFLNVSDGDNALVATPDGSVEIHYANAKKIETTNTGAVITGIATATRVEAGGALFNDNGASSPIVSVRADDASPWAFLIANDTYNSGDNGLHFNVENGGAANIRNIGASSYNDIKIGVVNGGTYHQTLTIDETGLAVLGTSGVTAGRLTLNDDGSNSPLLRIKTDDGSPYAMIVGNDSYNTGNYGLHQYQENGGNYFIRLVNNAEYKNLYIQTSNNTTAQTGIYIDPNRSVGLNYQGSSRLYTASGGTSTDPGVVVENGILQVTCTHDWQIQCKSTNAWAGIQFTDSSSSDQIWYAGSNGTFAIGGGGSNVTGKKLHIDGGTTIGSGADSWDPPTNGLKIQGIINVGAGSADNDISRFTNGDAGSEEFSHLQNRVLHSNGSGWDGHGSNDGSDPIIVCSTGNRAGNSDIGDSIGLLLHSASNDDNDYSPLIAFSSKANSGSYNSVYAAIVGKKTGQGADSNWNAGSLYFHTAGKESNRAPDQYMDATPDFFINRRGYTGTPRHPRFRAWKTGSNWSVSANEEMVWNNTEYNVGTCYSTSTGRFTAPVDGFYSLRFYSILYKHSTNDAVYVKVNGNRQKGGDTHFSTHGTNWENVGWTGIFSLTAGQYVSVFNGNSSVTYHGDNWSAFEGYLVSSEGW